MDSPGRHLCLFCLSLFREGLMGLSLWRAVQGPSRECSEASKHLVGLKWQMWDLQHSCLSQEFQVSREIRACPGLSSRLGSWYQFPVSPPRVTHHVSHFQPLRYLHFS